MKVKYYLIALFSLLTIIIIGGYWQYNKPARDLTGEKAEITVVAPELFDQFTKNEMQANKQYLDKVVQVRGNLQTIGRSQDGSLNLTLDTHSPTGGVICEVPAANVPNGFKLQPGQLITMKGQCTGYLMDVLLVKCVLANNP